MCLNVETEPQRALQFNKSRKWIFNYPNIDHKKVNTTIQYNIVIWVMVNSTRKPWAIYSIYLYFNFTECWHCTKYQFRSPDNVLQSVSAAPHSNRAWYWKMSEMWRSPNYATHSCPLVEFGRCPYISRCVAMRERPISDSWSYQISGIFYITRTRIIWKYENGAFEILDSFHLVYQECSLPSF